MGYEDIIVYSIIAVILVGSWVANLLKKQAESRQEQERQLKGQQSATSSANRPDLDALAARRREELRQAARARMQQRAGATGRTMAQAPRTMSREPQNLTMAERIARARAQAQYEERASELRQSQTARSQDDEAAARRRAAEEAARRRREQAEQERRATEARRRQEAERHARAEAQRRARAEAERRVRAEAGQRAKQAEAARGRQRDAESTRRTQQAAARRQATSGHRMPQTTPSPAPSRMPVRPPHPPIDSGESGAHRHVSEAETESAWAVPELVEGKGAAATAVRRLHTRRGLREAIIMKEILDAPVAIREDHLAQPV